MQVLVIGAGVVGLAIARAAARRGHDVIVAEATGGVGNGISSRNSEVIHAGIYYPTGSLRARHCDARTPHALRILRRARRRPQQMRQAHRRHQCGGACQGRGAAGAGAAERRRRAGADRRQRGAGARAGTLLHRRAVFAGIRHHRQPRLHAGAVGRARGSRRHDRFRDAGRAAVVCAGRSGRCNSAAATPASSPSTRW